MTVLRGVLADSEGVRFDGAFCCLILTSNGGVSNGAVSGRDCSGGVV